MSIKKKFRKTAVLLLFVSLSFFYIFHISSMWQRASRYSEDGSASLSVFVEASEFLSQNLKPNEMALVPMIDVFYSLNLQLRDKLVDYRPLWNSTGVILKADTTKEEELRVRSYFIDFLKENPQVRYVVRDWVDPYAKRLYEAATNDELMILLREVIVMPFTLSTGWGSKITIYENVRYDALFAMKLSTPPERYATLPSDVRVVFDSNGATIPKVGPSVGFYLPLETGINASKNNYLTIQIKPDIEGLNLITMFYFDKNRDGVFSGYDIDYAKPASFNQTQLGWIKGQWYKISQIIPKANDPIVQIAIVATGDNDGTLTLADLIVYTQIDVETVFIDASRWLLENLKENETALVSTPAMFTLANPNLKGKLVSYRSLWYSSEIVLRTNTTKPEVLEVRSYFIDFLKENPQVRYVVRDWVDPYAERLYEAAANDELMIILQELKVMTLTLGAGWSKIITIYENVRYDALFAMKLSTPPERYATLPSDVQVVFDSNGATIPKVGPSVGFYLPLETGINASKNNYLTIQIKLDVENLDLFIVFYYDKNRDGVFSGYDIDYTKPLVFNQTKLGLLKGEWYKIAQTVPKSDDPIVQIAIVATGDNDGTLTLADLVVYTQITSGG